jgi:dihydrofolate reductase
MRFWESGGGADQPGRIQDFATIWAAADKVVDSTSRQAPTTERTRIERTFDAEAVRRMKRTQERDLSVGGPGLAAHASRAGLVDEWHLFVAPVVIGSGTHYLPGGVRVQLDLQDERAFGHGMIDLRYATRTEHSP